MKQSVITESLAGAFRMSLNFLSQLGSLIVLGFLSIFAWLPYEARNVAIYRRAYKQSEQFPDSKVEYSVCLENLGTVCRLLLFSLACLLSLVVDLETTLLICIGLLFVINFVFFIRPEA